MIELRASARRIPLPMRLQSELEAMPPPKRAEAPMAMMSGDPADDKQ